MSRLVIDDSQRAIRMCWWIEEYQDIGGVLGKVKPNEIDQNDPDNRDLLIAYETAKSSPGVSEDCYGFRWESQAQAKNAYAAIRTAWKADRDAQKNKPWPEWAVTASKAGVEASAWMDAVATPALPHRYLTI